jgi:hypothetical protein
MLQKQQSTTVITLQALLSKEQTDMKQIKIRIILHNAHKKPLHLNGESPAGLDHNRNKKILQKNAKCTYSLSMSI